MKSSQMLFLHWRPVICSEYQSVLMSCCISHIWNKHVWKPKKMKCNNQNTQCFTIRCGIYFTEWNVILFIFSLMNHTGKNPISQSWNRKHIFDISRSDNCIIIFLCKFCLSRNEFGSSYWFFPILFILHGNFIFYFMSVREGGLITLQCWVRSSKFSHLQVHV